MSIAIKEECCNNTHIRILFHSDSLVKTEIELGLHCNMGAQEFTYICILIGCVQLGECVLSLPASRKSCLDVLLGFDVHRYINITSSF